MDIAARRRAKEPANGQTSAEGRTERELANGRTDGRKTRSIGSFTGRRNESRQPVTSSVYSCAPRKSRNLALRMQPKFQAQLGQIDILSLTLCT